MNLLADESVDGAIVDRLRADNHAVPYVAEMAPGIDDDTVLQRAMRNGALLLTGDRDFGELVFRLPAGARGCRAHPVGRSARRGEGRHRVARAC